MSDEDRQLSRIASRQHGCFTRAQARECGVTDAKLRSRVGRGVVEQTGANAFRFTAAPWSIEADLMSVVLDVGEPVACTGPTGASILSFDGYRLRRPFHLLVPRCRSLVRPGVHVHRTISWDLRDRTTERGFPVTTAARTLIELARHLPSDQLAVCLDSALRDGRLTEDSLHRRIVALRSQGRHGLPDLHEVLAGFEVIRGGHSWLEREYLRLLDGAGLPRPLTQQVLSKARDRLVRVDCRFPGTNIVVELLGYHFHRSRRQMGRDAERANALLRDGYRPFQFTYGHVVAEPGYVIETTRSALRGAA